MTTLDENVPEASYLIVPIVLIVYYRVVYTAVETLMKPCIIDIVRVLMNI